MSKLVSIGHRDYENRPTTNEKSLLMKSNSAGGGGGGEKVKFYDYISGGYNCFSPRKTAKEN